MFRDELYIKWSALQILGRIYIASEGINAQLSVPEHNWENFVKKVHSHELFNGIPFKVAVEDDAPEELRLKYRFLDLRKQKIHQNII